jgi:hypothetical protein
MTTEFDPSQTTRMLSSFEGVDEILAWLAGHGVEGHESGARQMWASRQQALAVGRPKDYQLTVKGKKRTKRTLRVKRIGPRRPVRRAYETNHHGLSPGAL